MEILVILLFIVLVIIIVSLRGAVLSRIDYLDEEIRRLRKDLQDRPAGAGGAAGAASAAAAATVPPRPATPGESEPYTPPAEIVQPHIFQRPLASAAPAPAAPASAAQAGAQPTAGSASAAGLASAGAAGPTRKPPMPPPPPHTPPPQPPKPGFFERHPDLEKFIGENLVSKIGIAILVLAIGFFVKYAIDNDWIGPVGRVGIGLLCGGILIGIAHLLRNSYKAFSSVLVGGGLAIFYFTIALAYHQYHLFSQTVSFIIMLVITAFAVILSILYDRQELAIIALVGGFVTPFLVSNGSGNYKVLFGYLLILNAGLLFIAYRKSWRLLNILAFGFTAILFTSWLFTLPDKEPVSTFNGGFLFATTFYLLFFIINILHNVRGNKKFIASDFGILLANTCLYFGLGLYMIAAMKMARYQGLFSACMGVFNLLTSYFLFRKKKVDVNILYLLIGITLTFISLTAPIQLHGHYITLFWASESVLLFWLSRKSGLRIIGLASLIVWIAMLVSLFMDWIAVYGDIGSPVQIIFNKGLMTTLYAAGCCYGQFLLRKRAEVSFTENISANAVIIVGCLLFFTGGALEIYHQFGYYYPHSDLYVLYLALYGFTWASLVTYAGSRWRWFPGDSYLTGLLAFGIFIYIVMAADIYSIQTELWAAGMQGHFMAHWATALLVGLLIYRTISWWRRGKIAKRVPESIITWLLCIVVLIYLSAETQLAVNSIFYSKEHSFDQIRDVYIRTGLPILWGLSSFVFMWLGMRYKYKTLRIISLVIFSVTLLKLFLYDIRRISVAGKIAAFFCLGVLLLVVSFMYQRLKKIIIEDEEKENI